MIRFKPFGGIRPTQTNAERVTIKNVDYYQSEEVQNQLDENPDSYLQIIRPTLVHSDEDLEERYQHIRKVFGDFLENEVLTEDVKSYYIYEQENEIKGVSFIGIIGLIHIDDFLDGKIKKHENTIEKREKTFANFLSHTHLQAEPILLTIPENQSIELLFTLATKKSPTLEFKGPDNHIHKLWQVKETLVVGQLRKAIEKLPALYIADGHHRMGSSAMYTQNMRKQDSDFFGGELYNYTMSILVPGNHLMIYDFNRLITDLNGLTETEFLKKLGETFQIIDKDQPYYPAHKHHISMYLNGKFYNLYVPQELRGVPKGLGELDTFLWEEHLMKPILGIENSRIDERVQFLKGTGDLDGILKLKEKVDSGDFKIAFSFYPISIDDLKLISDENLTMPPKSTYIEPKLLSGLTVFDMKEEY